MARGEIGAAERRKMPAVPRPHAPRPLLHRKRVLIPGLAVVLAMSYLGYVAFSGAAMYYLTVDELLARGAAAYGEDVRLSGKVLPASVEDDPATNTLRFSIADKKNTTGTAIPVVYAGVVPDAFKADADVVLEGKLTTAGTFEADNLLVKCPSKYKARQGGGSADDEHLPEHHSGAGSE
ncbi:MAG: cytochrome c maturation protein CcmE [Dehalococcoidia bacterium]|nr:cytochrome c maturation protein CcmE [Dehalococcoidia bacterium]